MKRYAVHYSGNRDHRACMPENSVLPYDDEFYGYASTLKTAKRYISEIKRESAHREPHNFRIYDLWAEHPYLSPVYQED